MGHQFSYFMLPTDVERVRQMLTKFSPYLILTWRSETAAPPVVENFEALWKGERNYHFYLVRPGDLSNVVIRHVPEQGYWTVQTDPSPVIEFRRDFCEGEILREARVYYKDGDYMPDGEFVMKSEAFRKWARSVLSRMKKGMRRLPSGYYIAPDAEAWAASGGKLIAGVKREITLS